MWAHDRPDAVVRGLDRCNPIAQRFVDGVLQRPAPRLHRTHLSTEQLHAEHVQALSLDIDSTHVDEALEAEQCGRRGGGNTVLTGSRLGDEAALAHTLGQQCLAHDVVELVRSGMGQVLAFEEQSDAEAFAQPPAFGDRRRTAPIVLQEIVQTPTEGRICPSGLKAGLELLASRHERLWHEPSAELAEASLSLRAAHQLADEAQPSSCQS